MSTGDGFGHLWEEAAPLNCYDLMALYKAVYKYIINYKCVKLHLKDGRTDKETCLLQRVDESHGVTAAIVVDVVCALSCLCLRPFVRSSLRWSLTLSKRRQEAGMLCTREK